MSSQDHITGTSAEADDSGERQAEAAPEHLPANAWVTLIIFAAFVVAGSSCVVVNFTNW